MDNIESFHEEQLSVRKSLSGMADNMNALPKKVNQIVLAAEIQVPLQLATRLGVEWLLDCTLMRREG